MKIIQRQPKITTTINIRNLKRMRCTKWDRHYKKRQRDGLESAPNNTMRKMNRKRFARSCSENLKSADYVAHYIFGHAKIRLNLLFSVLGVYNIYAIRMPHLSNLVASHHSCHSASPCFNRFTIQLLKSKRTNQATKENTHEIHLISIRVISMWWICVENIIIGEHPQKRSTSEGRHAFSLVSISSLIRFIVWTYTYTYTLCVALSIFQNFIVIVCNIISWNILNSTHVHIDASVSIFCRSFPSSYKWIYILCANAIIRCTEQTIETIEWLHLINWLNWQTHFEYQFKA